MPKTITTCSTPARSGVAVEWGSPALRIVADEVIAGTGPRPWPPICVGLIGTCVLSPTQMGRRRLLLGHQHDGQPVNLAIRGRTVIIAGEPVRANRGWPACCASS